MFSFTLHPNVYHTDGNVKGVLNMLERAWVRDLQPGDGTIYIVSGFANFNGGVRFYEVFDRHIKAGGRLVAILGGSASQSLSSRQVVKKLIEVGGDVHVVNRKRIMHAKCYGFASSQGQSLVVSSANFTGPGMSQNVEASIMLSEQQIQESGFEWSGLVSNVLNQNWDISQPDIQDDEHPSWRLLYDEFRGDVKLDDTQEVTMLITLVPNDAKRIHLPAGEVKGTQYFFLSKDSYDFFPPLTIRNRRGEKPTYSAKISLNYVDLNLIKTDSTVTFEAGNNLDFRLLTSKLNSTRLVSAGDMAAISRIGEKDYQLRIIRKNTALFASLSPYANNFIGHKGKRYGYLSNSRFQLSTGISLY